MKTLPAPIVCLQLATVAAACLAFALIGQYVFHLHPCKLCIWQRIPLGVIIALGLFGYGVKGSAKIMVGVSGIAFLINSGIALFHSGVERKWWPGLEGCSAPDMSGSIEDLMARIQTAAVSRCDEIPWDLFGLSMANYNVAVCAVMAAGCFIYLYRTRTSAARG